MASTSVDGLISGLDTTNLVNQLVQLERQPQLRLVAQQKALESTTSVYKTLNTRFDAILQAAKSLATPTDWQAMKATTGDTSRLTASASPTALAGNLTVSVERLATAHTIVSEVAVSGLDSVVASGDITFTVNGVASDPIAAGDGKLSTVVKAINDAKAGVSAAAVQVAPGEYRLQLTATNTGVVGAFTVDGLSLGEAGDGDAEVFDVLTTGTDAELKIGGSGGYSVISSSNTFTDLLPGVSVTAVKADPGVTVSVGVTADGDALATKVEKLVSAVNGALKMIEDSSSYDSATGKKGVLLGNSIARQLQQEIYSTLRLDLAGGSLGDVGMKLGENGLELDREKFIAAYAADPAKVVDSFTGGSTALETDGLATKLMALGTYASHKDTGLVSVAIASADSQVEIYEDKIADWDVRLSKRESTLRRQYAAMEVALSSLQNQSTWLAGQISGLPSWE